MNGVCTYPSPSLHAWFSRWYSIEKGHFSVKPCNQCSRRMRMLNKISQGTNHSFREGCFIGHQLVGLLLFLLLTSVPQAAAARPPRSHHLD